MAWTFGLLPLIFLPVQSALQGVIAVLLVTWLAARYTRRRIGGYTGDALGATQQVSELAFYLGVLCAFF